MNMNSEFSILLRNLNLALHVRREVGKNKLLLNVSYLVFLNKYRFITN